jgi:CRP-like cAMP-binding protein
VEGSRPSAAVLLVSGWACRYKQLENGRRQILSLLVPGDLSEPFGALAENMDHSIGAITPIVVAPINVAKAREVVSQNLQLSQTLWWDLLVSQSFLYERILSLGRRSAFERLGHLFCELYLRLDRVGLVEGQEFDMPISQADLGDLLGLSSVHVNRSLQELRLTGMLSLKERRLKIHDLARLRDASMFDSAYFHFEEDVLRSSPGANHG